MIIDMKRMYQQSQFGQRASSRLEDTSRAYNPCILENAISLIQLIERINRYSIIVIWRSQSLTPIYRFFGGTLIFFYTSENNIETERQGATAGAIISDSSTQKCSCGPTKHLPKKIFGPAPKGAGPQAVEVETLTAISDAVFEGRTMKFFPDIALIYSSLVFLRPPGSEVYFSIQKIVTLFEQSRFFLEFYKDNFF